MGRVEQKRAETLEGQVVVHLHEGDCLGKLGDRSEVPVVPTLSEMKEQAKPMLLGPCAGYDHRGDAVRSCLTACRLETGRRG